MFLGYTHLMLQIISKWIGINAPHILNAAMWLYILCAITCHGQHFLKS